MKILHIPAKKQPTGSFDNGRIQERKPISFPDSGGPLASYSNVLYWASAWGEEDGLIAEHPHRGFEIISYVVHGTLEHYDSVEQRWVQLHSGDAQMMQAGSGLSHAERIFKGTRMFQIWLDPGLHQSLHKAPRYFDYRREDFPLREYEGFSVRTVVGQGSPMHTDTPVRMADFRFAPGRHALEIAPESLLAIYVVEGKVEVDGVFAKKDDFILISDAEEFQVGVQKNAAIFVLESPVNPDYPVYSRMRVTSV